MSISTIAAVLAAVSIKFWPFHQNPISNSQSQYDCANHQYTTEILSTDPFMLYSNNFINQYEIDYLLNLNTNWTYPPNLPTDPKERQLFRTSSYTIIPADSEDPVVNCLVARADSFVGFIPSVGIEDLQIGRTQQGEHHALHVDYYIDPEPNNEGKICNRAASFFLFLSDVEEGGETYFPKVSSPPSHLYVDGNKFKLPKNKDSSGVMVRPVKGNAIFWMNMLQNGTMDDRSMHAGMEVVKGTKYGMNVLVEQCV